MTDTIKTRYQTQYMSSREDINKPLLAGERRYKSTWHCVTETFRQEGVVGTYRGMGITMFRAFIGNRSVNSEESDRLVNAVTLYGYEWTKEWLDR